MGKKYMSLYYTPLYESCPSLVTPHAQRERGKVIGRGVHIYTKYSTLPSGISAYIVPKVGIFPEAGGRGKYSLPRVQYMPILHKEGF